MDGYGVQLFSMGFEGKGPSDIGIDPVVIGGGAKKGGSTVAPVGREVGS